MSTYVPGASLISTRDQVVVRVPSTADGRARHGSATRLARCWPSMRVRLARVRAARWSRSRCTPPSRRTSEPPVVPGGRRPARVPSPPDDRGTQADIATPRFRIDVGPARRCAAPPDSAALADVLRHELVHVLTAPLLADAPAWVAEGLATEVSRPDMTSAGEPGQVAGPCPSDAARHPSGEPRGHARRLRPGRRLRRRRPAGRPRVLADLALR